MAATNNPVPSKDPNDLLFNAEKLDEVVNGASETYTTRLGAVRRTIAGFVADMLAQVALVTASKNTAVNTTIPAKVAEVEAARATAVNTTIPAQVALVDASVAATYVGQSAAAMAATVLAQAAAEMARDAALAAARIKASTAAGISAYPTSGDYFYVPATSVNESLVLYVNSGGNAVEVKRFPSAVALNNDLRGSPRDPVGLWAVDSYSASPQPFITNLANKSPGASLNLKRMPRRAFNSLFYNKTNVVVSDNSVEGVTVGTNDAAVVTGTGNWLLAFGSNQGTIPAGTYIIVATVKRNAGVDQLFAFTKDAGATRSAVQTATSAYQRLSYTFTLGAPSNNLNLALCSSDGVASAVLNLESLELFSGAVDPGRSVDDGNIYLGRAHGVAPAYAAGVLSNSANNVSACSLPARYAFPKWSFSALIEQASLTTTSGIFSDVNSFANFAAQVAGQPTTPGGSPMTAIANTVMTNFVGTLGGGMGQRGGFFNLVGKGYHLVTRTYDGVAEELWLDDVRLFRHERVLTDRNLRDFLAFVDVNGVGIGMNYAGLVGFWDRAVSAAEVRSFFYYQRLRNPLLNIPGLRTGRFIGIEGDSNHGGQSQTCWPWLFKDNDSPENIGTVWAVVGTRLDHTTDASLPTLPTLSDRAAQLDAVIPPDRFGRTFVLTIGTGTNDLGQYASAAAYITAFRAYCMARAAAGWKVCVFTIPPIDGNATHNTRRATVNADILANWASYGMESAARIINIAGDAIIGPDNSRAVNPTYWADTVHFSALGNAVVETYARAVINAV